MIVEIAFETLERGVEQRRHHRRIGLGERALLDRHLGDLKDGLYLDQPGHHLALDSGHTGHALGPVEQDQQRIAVKRGHHAILIEMRLRDPVGHQRQIPQHIGRARQRAAQCLGGRHRPRLKGAAGRTGLLGQNLILSCGISHRAGSLFSGGLFAKCMGGFGYQGL